MLEPDFMPDIPSGERVVEIEIKIRAVFGGDKPDKEIFDDNLTAITQLEPFYSVYVRNVSSEHDKDENFNYIWR